MDEELDGLSMNLEETNKDKLKQVFPECFTEGKLDIDKLLSLCGEYMTDDYERYEFKWKGKSECLQLAQKRSAGTLRPCVEESVNWEDTKNLYIEGDNLEVLKLLQRTYYHKVKMIYIDPPYNTGNDFVYEDDFKDPLERYREVTSQTTKSNPETMGRFHTSWLNMMYPRLRLAANLLREDGVCVISIDDAELYNLKKLSDEIFGEENYIATLVYDKNRKNDAKYFSVGHEYMLVYFKSAAAITDMGIIFRMTKEGIDEVKNEFARLKKIYDNDWDKVNQGLKALYASWPKDDERKSLARFTKVDEKGPYRDDGNISWPGGGGPRYDVIHPVTGKQCKIPDAGWRFPSYERMQEEIQKGRVVFGIDERTLPRIRRNLFEAEKEVMRSVNFSYAQTATLEFNKIFDNIRVFQNPKHYDDIKKLIEYITDKNESDIILDFFSGSATTAHAVMQFNAEDGGNRQFIMVQLPEVCDEKTEAYKAGYKNICEIGKERIRRAGKKIKEEWREKQKQITLSEESGEEKPTPPDIGFRVFKLDTSNCKVWDTSPVSEDNLTPLEERLKSMTTRVKPGRTDLDMVFEIMLKLGIPLTDQVIPMDISGKRAYSIWENCLVLVCLEKGVTLKQLEEMADYAPAQMVFAQDSFDGSVGKVNAEMTLQRFGIELKFV